MTREVKEIHFDAPTEDDLKANYLELSDGTPANVEITDLVVTPLPEKDWSLDTEGAVGGEKFLPELAETGDSAPSEAEEQDGSIPFSEEEDPYPEDEDFYNYLRD